MTAPDLERLLAPRSIAMVGASNKPNIGGWVFANLRRFAGPVHPVNPREEEVQGVKAFASVTDLPEAVDLVVVVVPAAFVPGVIEECGARGVGGAVVITSGFSETGADGEKLQDELSGAIARSGVRVIGPNCIGYMSLHDMVMANFALSPEVPLPPPGPVALVSQSGGFGSYIANKALLSGLKLGWFVSTGNEADVNIAAVLRFLVERPDTGVLLAFSETLRDPEVFIDAACRAAELDKPMVVLKAGRSEEAARAAMSHTASLVGSAAAFDAVCRQYGVYVVSTMEEMLDLGMIFQDGRRVKQRRVGIMTSSGGAGVLLADACARAGLEVPLLPASEQEAMLAMMPSPFYGSTANPVDTTAQVVSSPATYSQVLDALGASRVVDMVIPVTWAMKSPTNDAIVDFYQRSGKPVAITSTAWLDDFQEAGVPTYTDPQRAANALGALANQSLRAFHPTPPSAWTADAARTARARDILAGVAGQRSLLESTSKELLALYGVPVTREELVGSADEAVAAAARVGTPVALKVMSYDLPHKTEAGAVRLGVQGDGAVRTAYDDMLAEVGRRAPHAAIDGVLVQEMVPGRIELTCGLQRDPLFGPIVAVGLGGVAVEILGEAALLRPPFGADEVRAALAELAKGRLVAGGRGLDAAEQDAVVALAIGVGNLALELEQVAEIDVNPIRVADGAVRAADALVVLGGSDA
jgi:acetate---CoA ligase (ADP-forming)